MGPYNAAEWLVDRHVEAGDGERVAIRCRGVSTTYAEVQREMWRTQRALAALGVGTGDRVALVLDDDESFASWFLGALRAGVVPVPLSTMLTAAELGPIVADAQARVMVVADTHVDALPGILAVAPDVRHVVLTGGAGAPDQAGVTVHEDQVFTDGAEVPVADTSAESSAFWLYSSGTTGVPKGVMHVHGSPQATAETYARQVLDITPDDRFLSIAKLFFAYGLGNSLTFPFSVGATTILHPDPPTPAGIGALLVEERPTLFFASPGFAAGLLDAGLPPATFGSVRASVTAGESLPADIHRRFVELTGRPVLDGIGSTELLHIFISNTPSDQVPGSSGRVVPGYAAELRDEHDDVIAEPDTPGFLHVRGPSASTGYWRRDEATAASFRDGWVRTGDVYVRSPDDHWTFLGRNNDMIKAGGIWVSPAEVEGVLIEHPDVLEAAVVGARDDDGLETVVAFVVPASGAAPDQTALVRHCRDRIAAFKRPRRVLVVDDLPKTATGKIRRFALRARLADDAG